VEDLVTLPVSKYAFMVTIILLLQNLNILIGVSVAFVSGESCGRFRDVVGSWQRLGGRHWQWLRSSRRAGISTFFLGLLGIFFICWSIISGIGQTRRGDGPVGRHHGDSQGQSVDRNWPCSRSSCTQGQREGEDLVALFTDVLMTTWITVCLAMMWQLRHCWFIYGNVMGIAFYSMSWRKQLAWKKTFST